VAGSPSSEEIESGARFEKVQQTITDAAEAGDLSTSARPLKGGEMQDLPQHCWNTDELVARFRSCQIDPYFPYDADPPMESDPHWIFVEATSLDRVINSLKAISKGMAGETSPGPSPPDRVRRQGF
jgi:hypothetical protein